ncbi:MAG: S8 family serine peptidase [Candidatus Sericytochromatia bacterium]|nr:S8 family serine peptidase [Candidatus Sericytochromatia bacterium]
MGPWNPVHRSWGGWLAGLAACFALGCSHSLPSGGGIDGVWGGAARPRPDEGWSIAGRRVAQVFGEARTHGGPGWNLEALGLPAEGRAEGAVIRPVIAAVLDTGVDGRHPELGPVVLPGLDLVGREISDKQRPPVAYTGLDGNGHGTHVAGILTAVAGSGSVRILPVKAMDMTGGGEDQRIAQAVEAVISWVGPGGERVRILNLSIGGRTMSDRLAEALRGAARAGILLVAAAGNRGRGLDFPACLPEVLAIGATTLDDTLAPYSNRGPGMAFVAPGGDEDIPVWSTWPTYVVAGDLGRNRPQVLDGGMMGTSMAAPHVAGLAARLLARQPDLTSAALTRELRKRVTDLGPPGPDAWFGLGLPLWTAAPATGKR